MVQTEEEAVLILLKEDTKFATSKRITRIHTILDQMGLRGYNTNEEESALDMITSGMYKFDYLIISLEYEDLNNLILKSKQFFPKIGILVSYDKNTPDHEGKLSQLEKTYGIKCFLEKSSITMQNLTSSFKQIKTNMVLQRDSHQRYTFIQNINAGSQGIVDLYVDNDQKRLVAVKRIQIDGMNKAAKNNVLREVDLMKSVKVPTVIEFYDSTFDNDFRYIYMEYADGGTLEDKIKQCKIKGKTLEPDQVLSFICEIMIALYVMNKNKMIHRDLKSENILLKTEKYDNKEEFVAKLSDLGISRTKNDDNVEEMTLCGTPYYVSPEIASEFKNYDFKVDIWSLGVVLYESVLLKKPFGDPSDACQLKFNSNNDNTLSMGDLYEIIRTMPYPKLPKHFDKKLKALIEVMLMKNPVRRYSLYDIVKIDFVLEKIIELIKKNNWDTLTYKEQEGSASEGDLTFKLKDLVQEVFEIEKKGQMTRPYKLLDLINDEDVLILQESVKILEISSYTVYKKSFFSGTVNNTILGRTILDAYNELNESNTSSEAQSEEFFKKLLAKKILIPISHQNDDIDTLVSNFFENPDNSFYVFSFDQEIGIDNLKIIDESSLNFKPYYDLLTISQYVLYQGKKLIKKINLEKENEVHNSKEHFRFLAGIQLFAKFNINDLPSTDDKLAFLLNLYQIMFIHFILIISQEKATQRKEAAVRYQFNNFTLSSTEIKHVIFRGNKKPPGHYFRLVYNTDAKTQILPNFDDNRVLLILYDFNFDIYVNGLKGYRFKIFKQKGIDFQLSRVVLKFIYRCMKIDDGDNTIMLPSWLEEYAQDFNASDSKEMPQQLLKTLYEAYQKNRNKETPAIYRMITDPEEDKVLDLVFANFNALLKKLQNKTWKVIYA
jgi:serine/threonine protein kinase